MPIKLQIIGADQLVKAGQMSKVARGNLFQEIFSAAQKFGIDAVSIARTKYLKGPRPQKVDNVSGQLRASVTTKTISSGNIIKTSVGSNLIYAAIHEMGGTTHPNVTTKMRKYAWAMFFKTGEEKFKRMALTKKSRLTINIPARPYLRPAISDAMPNFTDNIRRILQKINLTGTAPGFKA